MGPRSVRIHVASPEDFAKQREHLRSVKNQERVRARVTEEVPKLTDPDIIERIEKYKGRNREDVEKGQ